MLCKSPLHEIKIVFVGLVKNSLTFCLSGPVANAQDLTEDEEAEAVDEDVVDDVNEEDDEAEVEDDENTELVSDAIGCRNVFLKAHR